MTVAQLRVERDVAKNTAKIRSILRDARADEWIVFPEGAVSGYFPQESDFLSGDPRQVADAVEEICAEATQRRCVLVLGSALHVDEAWRNSVIVQDPRGQRWRYDKIELSELDVRHFSAGRDVPVYDVGGVTVGIQMCRELLFPLAWHGLAARGARLVLHVDNAIKPIDAVWEHVIIARASRTTYLSAASTTPARPRRSHRTSCRRPARCW
jgi:predicted amidohydrolase